MSLSQSSFLTKSSASRSKVDASVRAYLDFDGTLTLRPGSQAVYSKLYRSLQVDSSASYSDAEFIPLNDMIEKLKIGLTDSQYQTMSLAPGALQFLLSLIELDSEVVIVTRNRKEYIQAMLLNAGMQEDLLKKIIINDVNTLDNGKMGVVYQHEKNSNLNPKCIIVCDDSAADCQEMVYGCTQSHATGKVLAHCEEPSKFNWDLILDEVKKTLNPTTGLTSV